MKIHKNIFLQFIFICLLFANHPFPIYAQTENLSSAQTINNPSPAEPESQETEETTPTEPQTPTEEPEAPIVKESNIISQQIDTGTNTSSTTNTTLINTTTTESQINTVPININQSENPNIYEQTTNEASPSAQIINTTNTNTDVQVLTTATANSGNNQQTASGSGEIIQDITTGSSQAVANSFTTINTNIVSSDLNFISINILEDNHSDIILPHPEYLFSSQQATFSATSNFTSTNTNTDVQVLTTATANSGNNQQTASGSGEIIQDITTGSSQAVANSIITANANFINTNLYSILITNLNSQNNLIIGWENPNNVSNIPLLTSSLNYSSSQNQTCTNCPSDLTSTNTNTDVQVLTTATANSGNNQQTASGSGEIIQDITTGNSQAVANSFTTINTNIVNSSFWQIFINILDPWTGNLVFAYPDLQISFENFPTTILPNQIANYTIKIKNIGLASARNSQVNINLPPQLKLISGRLSHNLGIITPQQSLSINVEVQATDLDHNIPQNLLISARASSSDSEDMSNNFVQAQTLFTSPPNTNTNTNSNNTSSEISFGDENNDSLHSSFQISVKNNVNDYVFTGDTVIFEINLKNIGTTAHNKQLYTALLNADGIQIGGGRVALGTVNSNQTIHITFNMTIPKFETGGQYQLIAWIDDDQAASSFAVRKRGNNLTSLFNNEETIAVYASNPNSSSILGANTSTSPTTNSLYFLILLLSVHFILRRLKKYIFGISPTTLIPLNK